MNLLTRSLSLVRTWLGLGDPTDERMTPSHGWLLPAVEVAERRKGAVSEPAPRVP
jgi:hypothetical protein